MNNSFVSSIGWPAHGVVKSVDLGVDLAKEKELLNLEADGRLLYLLPWNFRVQGSTSVFSIGTMALYATLGYVCYVMHDYMFVVAMKRAEAIKKAR